MSSLYILTTLTRSDTLASMSRKEPKKKDVSHAFTERICHWEYCRLCGLVALRNKATEDAIRKPCSGRE